MFHGIFQATFLGESIPHWSLKLEWDPENNLTETTPEFLATFFLECN